MPGRSMDRPDIPASQQRHRIRHATLPRRFVELIAGIAARRACLPDHAALERERLRHLRQLIELRLSPVGSAMTGPGTRAVLRPSACVMTSSQARAQLPLPLRLLPKVSRHKSRP